MLGLRLRLRVHDVLPGLTALKPRRIGRMTTDEGRELLCNVQGTIAARLIAISQARFAAGGSTNIISIFRRSSRPICRSPDSLQEMAGHRHPPVLRIAKYPGDWERGNLTSCGIKICFSPSKPFQILQRTCLVRLLVPNLCSYKRLANGAVKIIIAKRILAFDWSMDVIPPTLHLTRHVLIESSHFP
jgi:hypothetical protein